MKKLLSVSVAAGVLAMGSNAALAEGTLTDVLAASGITATGYAAAGFYHFDTDTFPYNAFQTDGSTFDLQQAAITIAKQPAEGFGAVVNLTAGSNATPISSIGTSADDFDVTQAYVQYAGNGLTLIGGKFVTLMGAEVINTTGNTNVSRSVGFFNAIAYTHTGLRATYAFTDTFSLTGGLNNGWDQQQDMNSGKTIELGMAWNPVSMFSLLVQGYSGDEVVDAVNDYSAKRKLIDGVAIVRPMDGLSLVLDVTSGTQEEAGGEGTDDAKWTAVAGYVNYQFTEKFRTSVRLEQFNDKDNFKLALGANPDGQKIKSGTVTVAYAPTASTEIRGEYRLDKAVDEVFTDGLAVEDNVHFIGIEGLYKF